MFVILHIIGGVYGGASTIRARLLPFLSVEASYLNGLLSNTGSDLYPLGWWRYPYAHLHTESEFLALAREYENNLNVLDVDLRHANVDNARLEAEYIIFFILLFFMFLTQRLIVVGYKKHEQN